MEQKQQMEGAKTTEGSVAKLAYLKKKSECEMEVFFMKQLVLHLKPFKSCCFVVNDVNMN